MKRISYLICSVLIIFISSGCGMNSGVVKTGEDSYKIYRRAGSGFQGGTGIREAASLEASKFCENQGKELKVLQVAGSHPPYIFGNFPKVEVQFTCLNLGDQELKEDVYGEDVKTKLKTLNKLLSDGLITKSDFEEQKKKMLNDYSNK